MSLITEDIKTELSELYSGPGRFYHDLTHVSALLALLDQHHDVIADPQAVEAAIWFHDAIYDSKAKDNETKSAELAVERLCTASAADPKSSRAGSSERVDRVRVMIEATTKHAVPDTLRAQGSEAALRDCEKFLDMDLSILASERAVFDRYEANVRREYAWAGDEAWRKGRAAVLESFLQRPRLFFTDILGAGAEDRARANLRGSIDRLRGAVGGAEDAAEE